MHFYKYQGTGNDFILLDDREGQFGMLSQTDVARMCDRRFGIGADGLMLLQSTTGYDFRMVYFNSDGRQGSMCGNGGRCIVAFAKQLGIIESHTRFLAVDGPHEAIISEAGDFVQLKMSEVSDINILPSHCVINTGSPHYVRFCDTLDELNVVAEGRAVRYSEPFAKDGINVNFLKQNDSAEIQLLTYERGVEDETFSCGTGATAAAIALHATGKTSAIEIKVNTKGGTLFVRFTPRPTSYVDVWLSGPAQKVFEGQIAHPPANTIIT